MKIFLGFVLFAAFAAPLPARAQLNDPNSMGNLLKDLPKTPNPQPGPTAVKVVVVKKGERVLALSLRGLLKQPWKVPAVSSVHGFVVDERRSDVILIARAGGRGTLDWRDFAEALRSARGSETPYCSLDPDPANLGGEQRLRVGGVRYDSHFGRVMADADYLMKKTTAGLVASPGLASFTDRLTAYFTEDCGRIAAQGSAPLLNRFWFTPSDPEPGDALSSGSGKTVWVKSRMSLLSEESLATQGGLVSAGRVNPLAAGYARDFSARLKDFSSRSEFGLFDQLHGLFQWVYVASLISSRASGDPETALMLSGWSDQVGTLEPSRARYAGILRTVDLSRCGAGYTASMMGGVQIAPRLPYSLPSSSDMDYLEHMVAEAVDAAPDETSWVLDSGLSSSFFAR